MYTRVTDKREREMLTLLSWVLALLDGNLVGCCNPVGTQVRSNDQSCFRWVPCLSHGDKRYRLLALRVACRQSNLQQAPRHQRNRRGHFLFIPTVVRAVDSVKLSVLSIQSQNKYGAAPKRRKRETRKQHTHAHTQAAVPTNKERS